MKIKGVTLYTKARCENRKCLCSNQFKAENKDLREQMAIFARKIATEVIDPSTLKAYCVNRLIPLDKAPGDPELQI